MMYLTSLGPNSPEEHPRSFTALRSHGRSARKPSQFSVMKKRLNHDDFAIVRNLFKSDRDV
jgi:hypothetical protein